jgi:F420-non-reducing hydrogenase iron-sulfur subunit
MKNIKIIAYCCTNSLHEDEDPAVQKTAKPNEVQVIELPCSSKVDVLYLINAFDSGADGVIVLGCYKEHCHYLEGCLRAEKRVGMTRELLAEIGIEPERVEMVHFRADKDDFGEICNKFLEKIQNLGPSFVRDGEKVK